MYELNMMVWAAFAVILSERLHALCYAMPSGRNSASRFIQAQVFMAPYLAWGLCKKLVPQSLRSSSESTSTTGQAQDANERDSKDRSTVLRRLASVSFGTIGWLHLVSIAVILAASGYSLYTSIRPFALGQRTIYQTGCKLSPIFRIVAVRRHS